MTFAFIGAGGASGVLFLIALAILVLVSVGLFISALVLAFKKRTKLSITAFLLSLLFAIYPVEVYVSYTRWAEIQKNRKKDFDVVAKLSPTGGYSITVDGTPNPDDSILLHGEITFHIDFSDSRTLDGRCTTFSSKRRDGKFASIEAGNINVPRESRSALIASMPPPPKGMQYDGQTDTYTIWFRKISPDFEWFTCMRRTDQP